MTSAFASLFAYTWTLLHANRPSSAQLATLKYGVFGRPGASDRLQTPKNGSLNPKKKSQREVVVWGTLADFRPSLLFVHD